MLKLIPCSVALSICIFYWLKWCQSQLVSIYACRSVVPLFVCLSSPLVLVVGWAGRPSLIEEHKGDCCGSSCSCVQRWMCSSVCVCVCCLLAGQIGRVYMALGPLVSFVVASVVFPIGVRSVQYLATSCHTNKSRKSVSLASFIHLLHLFSLSVNRMFLTVSFTHPPYPFFLSPGSAFLPLIFSGLFYYSTVSLAQLSFSVSSHSSSIPMDPVSIQKWCSAKLNC